LSLEAVNAAFVTASVDAICLTSALLGARIHLSTDSRPVWVGRDEMASVVDGGAVWPAN